MGRSLNELGVGFEPGLLLYQPQRLTFQVCVLFFYLRSPALVLMKTVALGDEDTENTDQQQNDEKGTGNPGYDNPIAHRLLLIVVKCGTRWAGPAWFLYYAAVDCVVAKHLFNTKELVVFAHAVCP